MLKQSILQALQEVDNSNATPMHMPGHKRNVSLSTYLKQLSANLDITEIYNCDSLHHAEGIIKNSMLRASSLWGTQNSYLLINGSTCGILSGIHACTKRGDTVLMARACHKSVYNAVELCGLNAEYLTQEQMPEGYCKCVNHLEIEEKLSKNSNIKIVVITSPTYEGYLSDIKQIADICHKNNTILMVDEAHGAHLGFCDYFTGGAVKGGADIIIQSLHKTLPSLTQTAIAHVQGTLVNTHDFANSLSIFQTSSPSYLLLASIDECVNLLLEQKEILFKNWENILKDFYEQCNFKHLKIVQENPNVKDPSKIVISTTKASINAMQLKDILREKYNIELEMAYADYALAMTGMGDVSQNLQNLLNALKSIDETLSFSEDTNKYVLNNLPKIAMNACDVRDKHITQKTPKEAINCVCASYIWAYPPGVPIIAVGEIISEELINLLTQLQKNNVDIQDTHNLWPNKISVISK